MECLENIPKGPLHRVEASNDHSKTVRYEMPGGSYIEISESTSPIRRVTTRAIRWTNELEFEDEYIGRKGVSDSEEYNPAMLLRSKIAFTQDYINPRPETKLDIVGRYIEVSANNPALQSATTPEWWTLEYPNLKVRWASRLAIGNPEPQNEMFIETQGSKNEEIESLLIHGTATAELLARLPETIE